MAAHKWQDFTAGACEYTNRDWTLYCMNPPPLMEVPPVHRRTLLLWLNLVLTLFLLDDLEGLPSFGREC